MAPAFRSNLLPRRKNTAPVGGSSMEIALAESFSANTCCVIVNKALLRRDCCRILSVFVGVLVTCTTNSSVIPVRGGEPRIRTAPRTLCS